MTNSPVTPRPVSVPNKVELIFFNVTAQPFRLGITVLCAVTLFI